MRSLALSVTQLNEYVRKSLAGDPMLHSLCIVGELSNFKRHVSGHWYFTLKDENAAISCAMFRASAASVRFVPQNGQRVRLFGSVGLYTKTGSYQFYADMMERDGMGELYLRFEALKQKLADEGLFDPALKKPLPFLPRGIGIVTSETGAVVHDIADVSRRRNPGMPLYLCPVSVQGDSAAQEIAEAIALFDEFEPVDVLIVGRGGGSMEDLWAFNEECVARAIAKCRKPIVSAVGHETDFTIADFVADLRAPTPSAAAELAVQERTALIATVDALEARLHHAFASALTERALRLSQLQKRLMALSPQARIERMESALRERVAHIGQMADTALVQKQQRLAHLLVRLKAASPMETVKRGYAIVTLGGKPLRSADGLRSGDSVHITLAQGAADASITSISKEESAWQV